MIDTVIITLCGPNSHLDSVPGSALADVCMCVNSITYACGTWTHTLLQDRCFRYNKVERQGHPGGIMVETHFISLLHVFYPPVSLTLTFPFLTIIYQHQQNQKCTKKLSGKQPEFLRIKLYFTIPVFFI